MMNSTTTALLALRELADMLASPQLPVQQRIAEDLGVDQPFISNARNGRLKRITPRVLRLREYARMRIEAAHAASRAATDMEKDVANDSSALNADERLGAASSASGRRYEDDALAGIKAYLQDGYDPRLIVEQLAVLRRAQRLRRPGRPFSGQSG